MDTVSLASRCIDKLRNVYIMIVERMMQMAYSTINIRVDAELKKQFTQLASEMGLSVSAAINVFLKASVNHWGMPFALEGEKLNEGTARVIDDTLARRNVAGPFETMEELKAYLDA